MRFAVTATAAAAAIAVPLAIGVSGPQMSQEDFLGAVRCTAYRAVAEQSLAVAEARWALNAEARRQPDEIAAVAGARGIQHHQKGAHSRAWLVGGATRGGLRRPAHRFYARLAPVGLSA